MYKLYITLFLFTRNLITINIITITAIAANKTKNVPKFLSILDDSNPNYANLELSLSSFSSLNFIIKLRILSVGISLKLTI